MQNIKHPFVCSKPGAAQARPASLQGCPRRGAPALRALRLPGGPTQAARHPGAGVPTELPNILTLKTQSSGLWVNVGRSGSLFPVCHLPYDLFFFKRMLVHCGLHQRRSEPAEQTQELTNEEEESNKDPHEDTKCVQ